MKVFKFGGTSMGTSERIRTVCDILLQAQKKDQIFAVVSAVGGVTNRLDECCHVASNGKADYESILKELEEQHIALIRDLLPVKAQGTVIGPVKILFNELEDILRGIFLLKELTPKSRDIVHSFGERLSSLIIARALQAANHKVALFDPKEVITCNDQFGLGIVDMPASTGKAKKHIQSLDQLTICPGFFGATHQGNLITLGRGGSDYSAALFANFWNAGELQIWTDVDGLMTADPRYVSRARVIPHLSYEEALELSHFGAKVLYPPSIQPALEQNIPILIKNTFHRDRTGTSITRSWEDTETIRGISSISDITLLNLSGSGMVGIPNFSHRLFQALSEQKVNVILITQASSEHTISVGIGSEDKQAAVSAINNAFEYEIKLHKVNPVEVEDELGIIALVGSNMKNQVGISGQMFDTLGRNGVSVKAIAQGSSERNISIVIEKDDIRKSLNALHESFFLDEIKTINLFMIGVGNVGSTLISQIHQQQDYLMEHHHLKLRIVGMANSRKMIFDPEGLNLQEWSDALNNGKKYSPEDFLSSMFSHNMRNSIFLDVTASTAIPSLYAEILKKSISIVTPNKIAATSPYPHYKTLKSLAQKFKAHFLFETNVCAGLPVISTLSDLMKSGDRIHKIEAVLSGTLNFIFNNYTGAESFETIVRRAKVEGYTEPDPRLDLSGEDVMRKILILVRESGLEMEMDDVKGEPFVPKQCMQQKDVDTFFTSLGDEEEHFHLIYKGAHIQNKRVRYVARYEDGMANTGLSFVAEDHPFYHLEGKDNIVLFYTDRYKDQPLVVKGAGAGAAVTASGIFADIMKVSN